MKIERKLWGLVFLLVWNIGFAKFAITVEAGGLNAAESSIISTISQTYEVNGAYYRVKSEYVDKARTYMSQDGVDISEEEANSYISQFYAAMEGGTSSEYVEKVGDVVKEEPAQEVPAPEEEKQSETVVVENESKTEADTKTEEQLDEELAQNEMVEEPRTIEEVKVTEETNIEIEQSVTKQEEVIKEDILQEAVTEDEKDYSDAPKNTNGIGVESLLLFVSLTTLIIAVVIIFVHKWKRKF